MKIALLGDIALFGCNSIHNNYQEKFRIIKERLSVFDYVIGNLETPLTNATRSIGGKSAYIKGVPSDVEILNYLGITHVSLANNHTFDYRKEGINETIETLEGAGIRWYGIKGKTEVIEDSYSRIRLHGYCCYSTNGKGMGDYIDVLDPLKIEDDIEEDKKNGFKTLLSIHWGQEHVHYPNYDHVKVARKLAEKGNIIIHGHHPHVLQGIEKKKESLIAYSLGNFCFDDVYTSKSKEPLIKLSEGNRETMMLGVEINGNEIQNAWIEGFSFDENEYHEALYIENKVKDWTIFLNKKEYEYRNIRLSQLNAYIDGRKKLRNVQWYLKRLNLESVRMIMAARHNQQEYRRCIEKYVEGL